MKRRALVASILLQILFVVALILFPLLSKGESIAAYSVTPNVPYRHGTVSDHHLRGLRPSTGSRTVCTYCFRNIPPTIATVDHRRIVDNPEPGEVDIPGTNEGQNIPGALDAFTKRPGPEPPVERRTEHKTPRTLQVSAGVQAARLVDRVEPLYPFLAKSVHREGRVELRAIIATDGHIKSLKVVTGDPMFISSALSAVQEWRYQPTLLNGEPVEVDTYITVVYTLTH